MPDPFKSQLEPANPLPSQRATERAPLNGSGVQMARDGYSVLERADPHDSFNRHLRGLAKPVSNDTPDVAWDEEK